MADAPTPQADDNIDVSKDAHTHYIRTFASDAAAVQSGIKPDLTKSLRPEALAKESREDVLARLANKSFQRGPETLDINATEMQAQGRPQSFAEEPATRAGERLVAPSPIPEYVPEPVAPPPPPPPPPQPAPGPAPIHTFQSDFRTEVKETGASKTSILAREQDAGPRPQAVEEKRSNTLLYVAGATFLIIGLGGAVGAYFYTSEKQAPVAVAPVATTRIFVDERTQIAGVGASLKDTVVAQAKATLALGAVRLLYVSTSTESGSDVFSLLKLPAPDILLRNIESAKSLAGIVNSNGQAPFFLLGVDSYGDTFAGMLAWEPRMQNDLNSFYPLYPDTLVASSTVGTTTKKVNGKTVIVPPPPPPPPGNLPVAFVDQVVSNHDARALKDRSGRTLIVYGYFDARTLIVTRNEAAFIEIINRLTTSRTQKQ